MEGIHIISTNISLHECLTLCCNEGPALCQYVWVFEGRCIALPCLTNMTACRPQTVDGLPSMLVAIKYNNTEIQNQTMSGLLYNMCWYSYGSSVVLL